MASLRAQFGQQHIARGVYRLTNVVVTEAQGSYVQLENGKKLLDFTTGIGVVILGICFSSFE
jgi:4-aminobutyrate aminotransferase